MSAATAPARAHVAPLALATHSGLPPLAHPRSPYADRPFTMTQLPVPEPARSVSPEAEGVDLSQIPEDIIDSAVFRQILELDEEGDEEFSYEMVSAYFKQARQTFDDMEAALYVTLQHCSPVLIDSRFNIRQVDGLEKLSSLGHYLKGSSAALGISQVQASCERIQFLGKRQEDEKEITEEDALKKLRDLVMQVQEEYVVAEKWLKGYYRVATTT